jgi:hypothetical protein
MVQLVGVVNAPGRRHAHPHHPETPHKEPCGRKRKRYVSGSPSIARFRTASWNHYYGTKAKCQFPPITSRGTRTRTNDERHPGQGVVEPRHRRGGGAGGVSLAEVPQRAQRLGSRKYTLLD